MDRDASETTYDVHFADGRSVEFDGKGNWKDVDCTPSGAVPAAIVPDQIAQYVAGNYPVEVYIYEISRDRHGWDVSLSNGRDLEFNKSYAIVDIDD